MHAQLQCETAPLPCSRTQSEWWWSSYKWRWRGGSSLWVNLLCCETGGPESSSMFSHPWRPAPCLAQEGFLRECKSVSGPEHHLKNTDSSRRTQARQRRGGQDQANGACGVARMRYDWQAGPEQKQQSNCLNIPEYFADLLYKAVIFPFLFPTVNPGRLVNSVLAICCSQHHSNDLWWHHWPRFKCRPLHRSICACVCLLSCLTCWIRVIDWFTKAPHYEPIMHIHTLVCWPIFLCGSRGKNS